MGVPSEKIQKLTEAGEVGFAEIEQAFKNMTTEGGRFAGYLEEYMKTFEGQVSMLTDVWQKSTGALTSGMFESLKGIVADLTKALQDNQKVLMEWGFILGETVKGLWVVFSAIGTVLKYVLGYIADLVLALNSLNLNWDLVIIVIGGVVAAFNPFIGALILIAETISYIIRLWDQFKNKANVTNIPKVNLEQTKRGRQEYITTAELKAMNEITDDLQKVIDKYKDEYLKAVAERAVKERTNIYAVAQYEYNQSLANIKEKSAGNEAVYNESVKYLNLYQKLVIAGIDKEEQERIKKLAEEEQERVGKLEEFLQKYQEEWEKIQAQEKVDNKSNIYAVAEYEYELEKRNIEEKLKGEDEYLKKALAVAEKIHQQKLRNIAVEEFGKRWENLIPKNPMNSEQWADVYGENTKYTDTLSAKEILSSLNLDSSLEDIDVYIKLIKSEVNKLQTSADAGTSANKILIATYTAIMHKVTNYIPILKAMSNNSAISSGTYPLDQDFWDNLKIAFVADYEKQDFFGTILKSIALSFEGTQLQGAFQEMSKAWTKVFENNKIINIIGDFFSNIGKGLSDNLFIKEWAKNFSLIGEGVSSFADSTGLTDISSALGNSFKFLTDIIGSDLLSIILKFIMGSEQVQKVLGAITDIVMNTLAPALKWVADIVAWLFDNVVVPFGNAVIDVINFLLGWMGIHLNYLTTIVFALAQELEATTSKKALSETIDYLRDKLDDMVSSQLSSLEDLYEVGAITASEYAKQADAISTQYDYEKSLLSNSDKQLNTLQGIYDRLVELLAVQATIDDSNLTDAEIIALVQSARVGGSFANGINNVPYNMIAQLHQGEKVVPANFSRAIDRGDISLSNGTSTNGGVHVTVNVAGSIKSENDLVATITNAIYRKQKMGVLVR
jgi:hypothetical protein